MIRLDNVAVERGGRRILRDVSICFERGVYYLLRGPTGSGKTTLQHVIAGLVEPTTGQRRYAPPVADGADEGHASAGSIGYVLQDPASQIILPKVHDEIAFGPLNLGLSGDEVERRVEYWSGVLEVARVCGGNTRTFLLSGGQQQLVVLAAIFALQPQILLLDEPTSMLDEGNARLFQQCINRYRKERPDVVIVHATHEYLPLLEPDRVVRIEQGGVRCVDLTHSATGSFRYSDPMSSNDPGATEESLVPVPSAGRSNDASLLSCKELCFSYKAQRALFQDLGFSLLPGECLMVVGGNGTGKSTLLDLLGGWLKPQRGEIAYSSGVRVGAIFQHIGDTLFARTVRDELRISLRDEADDQREQKIDEVLREFQLEYVEGVDVMRLSGGEKRLLAIAAVAVSRPEVLLLDEPLLGLDDLRRKQVLSLFRKWLAEGKGLVMMANRIRDAQAPGHKLLLLKQGSYALVDRKDCSSELLQEYLS